MITASDIKKWKLARGNARIDVAENGSPTIVTKNTTGVEVHSPVFAPTTFNRTVALQANPIGFNSYELLYSYILNGTYSYSTMLTYFNQCNVNLVRIAYPVFSAAEYAANVFASGTPTGEFTDADFRPTFLSRNDEVFDAAAASGVKLLVCLFFSAQAIATLCSETLVVALKTNSASYSLMQRFTRWFGKRYGQHPAVGAYSFFNEQPYDTAGITNPTPSDLGAVNAGLVEIMRQYSNAVATTDYVFLTLNDTPGRPTFTSELANFRTVCAGVDAIGVHIYGHAPSGVGMSYVGMIGTSTAAFGPTTANTLGYEGMESVLSGLRSVADAMGVPLWITECGVPTDVELAANSVRRTKVLTLCQQHADVSLVWNAANVAAPQPNQVVWQIQPDTTLGNTYKTLISSLNTSRVPKSPVVGAATNSLRLRRQPRYCMSSTRTAGATVRATSISTMTSSTQAFLAWVRRDATLNNFEFLFDARGTGNLSGIGFLAGAVASTDAEYADFRGASGGAGNTSGRLPRLASSEWHHIALIHRTINSQSGIELWLDGMFYGAGINSGGAYVGIPTATTLYALGGASTGAPISMQDVTLAHYATPEDIWSHMAGNVLPQSYLHLRADSTTVLDMSRSNLIVTVGSGVTFRPA